jgi:iron complex transport system substrate-binding protein
MLHYLSSFVLAFLLSFTHHASGLVHIAILDDLDRTVSLPSPAQSIVSLAPSITETLFAIRAGNQVVGVTDYCNYPEEATSKSRVGGITNPNIETIVSLRPDLIILSMEGNVREDFDKLLSFGIPVFVTNPRTLQGIHKSIEDLGILTGKTEEAAQLVHSMQAREESVIRAVPQRKKKTLLIVSLQPLIVVGGGTYLSELIRLAGGMNLAISASSTYPMYSRETVVAEDPDVLIIMSDILTDQSMLLTLFPEWEVLTAVQSNQIYGVDADIVTRPGPRAVDGLESLYQILHEGQ